LTKTLVEGAAGLRERTASRELLVLVMMMLAVLQKMARDLVLLRAVQGWVLLRPRKMAVLVVLMVQLN
jgi:hypothetical protein